MLISLIVSLRNTTAGTRGWQNVSVWQTKDYWRKIARKSNDPLEWAAYKNFKREVKRELRLAEREHVENQITNNPNNPRCV